MKLKQQCYNYNVTIMTGGQMRNCDNFKLLPKTEGRQEG